jgi:glycerol-3-phosphate dehydrogenase
VASAARRIRLIPGDDRVVPEGVTSTGRFARCHPAAALAGGINAVSAASVASVIDRADFGSFTSQESSNLVWGGFKYLENYELPLVFGLCRSRNRLMKAYPDNIKEISFLATLDAVAPYPPWFAGLGALGLLGHRAVRHRSRRGCSTPRRSRTRAGHRHRAACAAASSTRTPT